MAIDPLTGSLIVGGLSGLGQFFGGRNRDEQADRQWRLAQERLNLERMEAGRRQYQDLLEQRRRRAVARNAAPILNNLATASFSNPGGTLDIQALLAGAQRGGGGKSMLDEMRVNGPGSRRKTGGGGIASHLIPQVKRY